MSIVVGIDLGTSHCSLAWCEESPGAAPRTLELDQWVEGGRRASDPLLPSVLYRAMEGELVGVGAGEWIAGRYARQRAGEVPTRGIASAKSWLCHGGVDRRREILPWGELGQDEPGARLSPVEVSRRLLVHLREQLAAHRPGFGAESGEVILTVPASFDPAARQLTVDAAVSAGLSVRLLEEPLAAFYDCAERAAGELTSLLQGRSTLEVLVCDVGGGTLDLSLVEVRLEQGELRATRGAVGDHLLLGGDNMDLALARHVEARLGAPALEPGQLPSLLAACRRAKEVLLGPDPPARYPIRLASRGSSLLSSGVRGVDVEREEAVALLLDGFFPEVALSQEPKRGRAGLSAVGLPYERDPAVTRHVASFLRRRAAGRLPDALLLTGGVAGSPAVVERLRSCFTKWGATVALLSPGNVSLAVSRGAVFHGLSLRGLGRRIEAGASRAYYVGFQAAGDAAHAVCVLPQGSVEGEQHVAQGTGFELLVDRLARFDLYSSDVAEHAVGDLVAVSETPLTRLSPLVARVASGAGVGHLRVHLQAELSALGTLQLRCLPEPGSSDAPSAAPIALDFDLGGEGPVAAPSAAPPSAAPRSSGRLPAAADEALARVFGKGKKDISEREVKDLPRSLERALGPRSAWDLLLLRRLAARLVQMRKGRGRSADHERVFWMLTGFCLRPGFGYPGDEEQVAELFRELRYGPRYADSERGWQQFWIAWRRLCGGLAEAEQTQLRTLLDSHLGPEGERPKRPKGFRPRAASEMLTLATYLERVPSERRRRLGSWIVERTWTDRDPSLWSQLGRVGARQPTYASAHYCVDPRPVERWVGQLLQERWQELPTAAAAAVSLCRVTGDRARDLSSSVRQEVAHRLAQHGAPEPWQRAVREVVPISRGERATLLGDDLPQGLQLSEWPREIA